MLLQKGSATRFLRLYDALINYALDCMGCSRGESAASDAGHPSDEDYFSAMKYVWGPTGDGKIVQDFVRENPARLSKEDRDQVEVWRDGLFARFDVVRSGAETYFLVGDYGFLARGADCEVDVCISRMPTCVETVLLPYGNLIVFGVCAREVEGANVARIEAEGLRMVDCMRARGTLVRNTYDYLRLINVINDENLRLEGERAQKAEDSYDDIVYDLDMTAGSGGYYEDLCNVTAQDHAIRLREQREKGRPTKSLAKVLSSHDYHDLERLLNALTAGSTHLPCDIFHDELVERVIEAWHPTPRDLVCWSMVKGSWHAIDLKRMVDAGGAIRRQRRNRIRIKELPEAVFPCIQVYEVGDDFIALMPDEVMEVLEDADWEEVEALIDDQEISLSELESEIDFRGIIEEGEAVDYLASILPYEVSPEDRADLAAMVTWCLRESVQSVATGDGARYVVTRQLAKMLHPVRGVARDRTLIDRILTVREGIEPRHIDDMPEFTMVIDYAFESRGWADLSAYLRFNGIPDSAFSLVHAELSNDIVYATRVCDDVEETVREVIERYGGNVSGDEADYYIKAYVRQLPLWTLNGWAPRDLEG